MAGMKPRSTYVIIFGISIATGKESIIVDLRPQCVPPCLDPTSEVDELGGIAPHPEKIGCLRHCCQTLDILNYTNNYYTSI